MNLQAAKILITGASSGIGLASAQELVTQGAHVVITGLESERISRVGNDLGVPWIAADLRKDNGISDVFGFAIEKLHGMDVLINNAGWATIKHLEDLTRHDFEDMFSLNTIAPALLAQKALPYFKQQGSGNIINIGATGGSYGFPGGSVYGASKAALTEMSRCWRTELRKHNVRVMQIDPSWVTDTYNRNGQYIPSHEHKLQPTDIAHAIVSMLKMENRGFIPELSIWATNPDQPSDQA